SAGTLVQRAKFGLDPYGIRDATHAPVSQIHCPILFVLGSEELEIGRQEDLPTLQRNARSASSAETAYIEGADHVYRGREPVVADAIAERLGNLSRPPLAN